MTELAIGFIGFTVAVLALAPAIVGFFVPRWWWPAAWPVVGFGIMWLSLRVSQNLLPGQSHDGWPGLGVVWLYFLVGCIGIVTALFVVAIRRGLH